MQRVKPVNKFYRRYEVDLWGRAGRQGDNKTVRLLQKVQKEVINRRFFKKKHKISFKKEKKHKTRDRRIKTIKSDKNLRRLKNKTKLKPKSKSKKGKKRRVSSGKKRNKHNKFKKQRVFLYRIDYADPQRRKAKTSLSRELFLVKNKLLRFYANIKKHQLRRYANTRTFKIKFKLVRGLGDQNIAKYHSKKIFQKILALDAFFSLVEHRLDIMVYRSNFSTTIQQSRHLINHRHVNVNGRVITHCGYMLKNFHVVNLNPGMEEHLVKKLKSNLLRKRIALYMPKYIYADYTLMKSMIVSNPVTKTVPFPFKIDLSKWLGLAKHLF